MKPSNGWWDSLWVFVVRWHQPHMQSVAGQRQKPLSLKPNLTPLGTVGRASSVCVLIVLQCEEVCDSVTLSAWYLPHYVLTCSGHSRGTHLPDTVHDAWRPRAYPPETRTSSQLLTQESPDLKSTHFVSTCKLTLQARWEVLRNLKWLKFKHRTVTKYLKAMSWSPTPRTVQVPCLSVTNLVAKTNP